MTWFVSVILKTWCLSQSSRVLFVCLFTQMTTFSGCGAPGFWVLLSNFPKWLPCTQALGLTGLSNLNLLARLWYRCSWFSPTLEIRNWDLEELRLLPYIIKLMNGKASVSKVEIQETLLNCYWNEKFRHQLLVQCYFQLKEE